MEFVVILLQLLSMLYFVIGIGLFLNKEYYKKVFANIGKEDSLTGIIIGFISFTIGYFIIVFIGAAPIGIKEWIVFIFGVLAVLKGVVYLLFPNFLRYIGERKIIFQINSIAMCIILFSVILFYISLL